MITLQEDSKNPRVTSEDLPALLFGLLMFMIPLSDKH